MSHIKTSKGFLEYKSHLLYFGDKVMNKEVMLDNLRVLALYMDKIDINWGPAFGTLIGYLTYKCNLEVQGVKFDEEEDMLQLEFYRNRISELEKSMAEEKKENAERMWLEILMRKYGIIPQPQGCPF